MTAEAERLPLVMADEPVEEMSAAREPRQDWAEGGLEAALVEVDRSLGVTLKAQAAAQRQLKRTLDAARQGRVRDLAGALDALVEHSQALTQAALNARGSWSFDVSAYLESGRYLAEVVELAERSGLLGVREIDGQLYSFPVVVKVKPRDLAVELSRKQERGVRPSWLVGRLRKLRESKSSNNVSTLLEAFERAYLLLTHGQDGRAVRLRELYGVLVLRPGQIREYSQTDFMLDVYRLDRAAGQEPLRTRAGRELSLPASTGAKAGQGIRLVTETGEERTYHSIRFDSR
jgi:hypothetical protein